MLAVPLGSPPIVTRGEAREGLVVRRIERAGEWILPRRQGVLASKPPCYHWVAALAGRVFGSSDATVRLPSAIGAMAMVASVVVLASDLGLFAASLAAVALTASWGFWLSALEARVDMLFAAAVTIALTGAWRAMAGGTATSRLALWGGVTVAVLTKGPAGAALVGGVLAGYALWSARGGGLRRLWSAPLAGGAVVLTAGWYAAAWWIGGVEFLRLHVQKENVERLLGVGDFAGDRRHAPFKLIGAFAARLYPWNLAALTSLRGHPQGGRSLPLERFLHAWWLVVLAVFTLAAKRRSVYLLPLYPAIAVLAAGALTARVRSRRGRAVLLGVALGLSLAAYVATLHVRVRVAEAHGLGEAAAAMAEALPSDATLFAAAGAPENDVLVLGYLLDRPILRRRRPCETGATHALVPRGQRPSVDPALVVVDRPPASLLVRCAGAR